MTYPGYVKSASKATCYVSADYTDDLFSIESRKRWEDDEDQAVRKEFGRYLTSRTMPPTKELKEVQLKYPKLASRKLQQIRSHIQYLTKKQN